MITISGLLKDHIIKPLLYLLPDKLYLELLWLLKTGKILNLKHPKTFNEKLQWLKLYDRNPNYSIMVDKYRVREYIKEIIGEEYLVPLIGVWNDPDEIDFDSLPDQFVLKCNHNSGTGMYICKDKSSMNIEEVKKGLRKGLKENYYLHGREWPYKNVPRKIICEKYLTDDVNESLTDYKIHNFNGVPKVILVCKDRFSASGVSEDFFSTQWEHLDVKRPNIRCAEDIPTAPSELHEMLSIASILAKDIPFVRTDFYTIKNKVFFGEMTFYPANGLESFEPKNYDELFGGYLSINDKSGGGTIKK